MERKVLCRPRQCKQVTPHKKKEGTAAQPRNNYRVVRRSIGSGTFGKVSQCIAENGETVAIKRVIVDPQYESNEFEILQQINHRNVIKVLDHFVVKCPKTNIITHNIVMEYIEQSLYDFVSFYYLSGKRVPIFYIKLFSFQLFCGLNHVHSKGFMHRDIKPENILVNKKTGQLKICDFGSASRFKKGQKYETYIASRYFRAPELLMESPLYGMPIDVWAAGCVIFELLSCSILFRGDSNKEQLESIEKIIGNPTFSDLHSIPHEQVCPTIKEQPITLDAVFPVNTPADIKDLLKQILVYSPDKRPTAMECMKHKFFDELFVKGMTMPNGSPLPPLARQ